MAALGFLQMGMAAFQTAAQNDMGAAQDASMKIQAIHTENEANQVQAVSQRAAILEKRRARYVRSRALAVAGASGSGVDDPTVTNVIDGIDEEGDANFMNALFTGDYGAAALRREAGAMRREGRAYRANASGAAAMTALNGLSNFAASNPSFFSKYGGDRAASTIGQGTGYSDFARGSPSGFDFIDAKAPEYHA